VLTAGHPGRAGAYSAGVLVEAALRTVKGRAEDKDAFMTGAPQNMQEFTLTAELKHKDGVMMRI